MLSFLFFRRVHKQSNKEEIDEMNEIEKDFDEEQREGNRDGVLSYRNDENIYSNKASTSTSYCFKYSLKMLVFCLVIKFSTEY